MASRLSALYLHVGFGLFQMERCSSGECEERKDNNNVVGNKSVNLLQF